MRLDKLTTMGRWMTRRLRNANVSWGDLLSSQNTTKSEGMPLYSISTTAFSRPSSDHVESRKLIESKPAWCSNTEVVGAGVAAPVRCCCGFSPIPHIQRNALMPAPEGPRSINDWLCLTRSSRLLTKSTLA